jgi:hypothetical protein
MNTENLWGQIPTSGPRPPVALLREQAAVIGQMTDNIIVGTVDSGRAGHDFVFDLIVTAPALDNYMYTILSVRHGVDMYPLVLIDQTNTRTFDCSNEDNFKDRLRDTLSSEKVHKVIAGLIEQSKVLDQSPSE